MTDRSEFIYENGYGVTTDVYMLPTGTKFSVVNGRWHGEAIEEHGKRFIWMPEPRRKFELTEDQDYSLVLTGVKLP